MRRQDVLDRKEDARWLEKNDDSMLLSSLPLFLSLVLTMGTWSQWRSFSSSENE
jgi:hypothetical protein